jgi:hypothetical protein
VSNTVGTIAFWSPEAVATPAPSENVELDVDDMLDMDPPEATQYSAIAADAWAAGLTLHCLLYGVLPFPVAGKGPMDIINSISALDPFATTIGASEEGADLDYSSRGEDVNEVWRHMLVPISGGSGSGVGRWGVQDALKGVWIHREVMRRRESGQEEEEEAK